MSQHSSQYPLHWSVWENNVAQLKNLLSKSTDINLELRDPRGRTPLHLAIILERLDCARVLLEHNADALVANGDYWEPEDEAVATGNPDMIRLVCSYARAQMLHRQSLVVPKLLRKLIETTDLYAEITWEFSSWVPFVSSYCPSDTFKVYKSGSNLRVDMSLVGFDGSPSSRRPTTFVFSIGSDGVGQFDEIDHERRKVTRHRFESPFNESGTLELNVVPSELVAQASLSALEVEQRLSRPVVTAYLDTDRIQFERHRSGFWAWRSDRSELVNGYDCRVFQVQNVEVVTKTRLDHLNEVQRNQLEQASQSEDNMLIKLFMGAESVEDGSVTESSETIHNQVSSAAATGEADDKTTDDSSGNACKHLPSAEQYFDLSLDSDIISRRRLVKKRVQNFRATLWLADKFPLDLKEQIVPIIDLVSDYSVHFKKLKQFIALQLPSGFPVRAEIPLFAVLRAKVTFTNVHATDRAVEGVTRLEDNTGVYCAIADSVFAAPSGYRMRQRSTAGAGRAAARGSAVDEPDVWALGTSSNLEDELLQLAIQRSLRDPSPPSAADADYDFVDDYVPQRPTHMPVAPDAANLDPLPLDYDHTLQHVIELSRRESAQARQMQLDEDAELLRIIELSKIEK